MSIALPRSPLRTSTLISVYSAQSIRSLSHTTTITTPNSLILTPPKPGPPLQFVRMSSSSTPPSTTNPAPVRHKEQDKSKDKDTPGGKGREGQERIFFGPFDVTTQVFLTTPYSFALVNLKPLLPGHVLVCTRRPHRRMTDLSPLEVADLFTSVQRVQRMLARFYFSDSSSGVCPPTRGHGDVLDGSFNIALQDGPEAGQTVPHVHVHVIPRIRGTTAKPASTDADAVYDGMAGEAGNVGGALWDREHGIPNGTTSSSSTATTPQAGTASSSSSVSAPASSASSTSPATAAVPELMSERPKPGGGFPRIEDADRIPRSMEDMEAEAERYRKVLETMRIEEEEEKKKQTET